MPSTLTFERQKMSVEIWEKLKSHIMKQREKRKQEQEQDAEQERHRREQELKRKRDATTLEDIKDQLSKLDSNLSELHKQKHELFIQLKKVLHEDDARKRHQESEMLAARQAALQHAQSQNNQQYPFYMSNTVTPNNSRLNSNQSQPTQQQLNNAMQQQQQLLSKHSPITTTIANLSTQPNYIHSNSNTVIKQPPSAHQQSQQQQQQLNTSTNKQKANLKRPLERSSPQLFNNIIPNSSFNKAPTLSTAYTPSVSRIPSTSQQAFFPTQPNRHLSIPVSQPSISSGQLNFDTKTNQYLSNFLSLPDVHAEHSNLLNTQLSPQQIHQLQQQQELLYGQQFLKNFNMSNLPIPMQNAALKNQSGSITSGFPMQRNSTPTSMNNNSNKFNQNNRYNMF